MIMGAAKQINTLRLSSLTHFRSQDAVLIVLGVFLCKYDIGYIYGAFESKTSYIIILCLPVLKSFLLMVLYSWFSRVQWEHIYEGYPKSKVSKALGA